MSEATAAPQAATATSGRARIAPGYGQTTAIPAAPWDEGDGVRIAGVDVFLTAPDGVTLVVVRVRTSVDGLVGWGCATFTQRAHAVAQVLETYLGPLVVGRRVDDITDIWHTTTLDAYWRGGPVLNSALSGIDQALWDIAGKRAGMPVWQLLGGRVRTVAEAYVHASGRDVEELGDQIEQALDAGYRHVRCQVTIPGTSTYGAAQHDRSHTSWDPDVYVRTIPGVFAGLAERYGARARLLHDVHERVAPWQALQLLRDLEPYGLLFVEDPVAPEDQGWLPRLREASATPLAYGELLTSVDAFAPLISGRLVDYVRSHVSAIGGVTPAWRLAALAEVHGVRTAWHGPRDVSPIGHAASLAMDIASPAFGIHEHFEFSDAAREVFPGTFEAVGGALSPSSAPGWGVGFDEREALRHPPAAPASNWHYSRVRRTGGASQRP